MLMILRIPHVSLNLGCGMRLTRGRGIIWVIKTNDRDVTGNCITVYRVAGNISQTDNLHILHYYFLQILCLSLGRQCNTQPNT